jgi:hypothetical protein
METCGEYLVSHGSGGAVGRFAAEGPLSCRRGDRVVVESRRGLELGVVLCPTTPRHARLLADPAVGRLVRRATDADESEARRLRALANTLFEEGRRLAAERALPFEILDVELLLDGRRAVVQHLRWADCDYAPFAETLGCVHGVEILMEDLAVAAAPAEEEHGGCGEPGCGRAGGGSGCTSCGTGGGCSSCGSKKVDMRDYFAHLRTQMEQKQRVPLL